jgi:hypothetical protein
MEGAVDVKMDLPDRDGLLVGTGLAPAFERQGTHDKTSIVDCWATGLGGYCPFSMPSLV